jgi:hypothetical protein
MSLAASERTSFVLGVVPRKNASSLRAFWRIVLVIAVTFAFTIVLFSSLFIGRGVLGFTRAIHAWSLMTGISSLLALGAIPLLRRHARVRFPRIAAITRKSIYIQMGSQSRRTALSDVFWRTGYLSDEADGTFLPRQRTILLVTPDGSFACGSNPARLERTQRILELVQIPRLSWWSIRSLVYCAMLQAVVLMHAGIQLGVIIGLKVDGQLNANQWQRTLPVTLGLLMPLGGGTLTVAISRRGGPQLTFQNMLLHGALLIGAFACVGFEAARGLPLDARIIYAFFWAGVGFTVVNAFHKIRRA